MPYIAKILGKDAYYELLEKLDIATAPLTAQNDLVLALSENIAARIIIEVAPKLEPDERSHLNEILAENNTEELFGILHKRLPDFDAVLRRAAEEEIADTMKLTAE